MTIKMDIGEFVSRLAEHQGDLNELKKEIEIKTISVTNWHLLSLADAYTTYKCAENYVGNSASYIAECREDYYDAIRRADIPFAMAEEIAWFAKQNYAELTVKARIDDAAETEFEV